MERGGLFAVYCIAAVLSGFFICVLIHETGHLIGGLFSGYRFSSFEIMGIRVIRSGKGLRLGIRKSKCIGQCVMYSEDFRNNASALILGGIAANIIAALISGLILAFRVKNFLYGTDPGRFETKALGFTVAGITVAVFNIFAVICNLVPCSRTNDGSTFIDARKSYLHTEAYNRIMYIYAKLNEGFGFEEIDGMVFDLPDMPLSSLSAELAFYRYLHSRSEGVLKESMEIKRLERFAPGLVEGDWKFESS